MEKTMEYYSDLMREAKLKQSNVREACKDLDDYYDSTRTALQTRLRELRGREERLAAAEKKLEAEELGFKSKAEEFVQIEKRIEEEKSELDSLKALNEKQTEELEMRERRLREKEKECGSISEQVEERSKELSELQGVVDLLREEMFELIREFEDLSCRLESDEKREKEMESRCRMLEKKVKQLEERAKDLELEHTHSAGTNILPSPVEIEELGSSVAVNATTISTPNSSIQSDMLTTLLSSSDPAKNVLNRVQKSFDQYWTSRDVGVKEGIMLDNILLLQCLIIVSPHIRHRLKEDAKLLADSWRAEMKGSTENAFDGVGFLLFISAFDLVSTIKKKETIKLFGLISQNTCALEKCQAYGFAEKNADDFIRSLIKKKQLIQAVGFIRAFKLVKYHPVPLLKEYVDSVKKWSVDHCSLEIPIDTKIELLDSEIADLRAVCQCVKHHHLESEYPPTDIEMQVVQVKNLKELLRREQEQRKRKKPDSSSSAPEFKRGRTAA